ncbi:MAG TPA: nucleotide exchange factor GrpE [Gemmatimonadaceae bacterium]|nr:nucleotide exchange factor GrpE [Gemmatimonadaceae bacterium]
MDYPNDRIGDEALARSGAADPMPEDVGGEAAAPAVEQGSSDVAAELRRQLDEQRDKYLRLAAEYDNFRKRSGRERQEAGTRAQADLVKQLLDALDDLSRFAHVDPETVDAGTVVQGADMVEKKLQKALSAAGLEAINPVDQAFDPSLHEAVSTEPALSSEDDHLIARVFQQGYRFNGQLLRPARVVVKQWNG